MASDATIPHTKNQIFLGGIPPNPLVMRLLENLFYSKLITYSPC